jgi:hypothetical protein
MAGFLAVGIAILLAIVLCAGYALVLRELRQINANLERLIELMAKARRHDEPPREDIGWNTQSAYRMGVFRRRLTCSLMSFHQRRFSSVQSLTGSMLNVARLPDDAWFAL